MGTTITVKLAPEHFDYIRKLLKSHADECITQGKDKTLGANVRAQLRTEGAKASLLLEQLNRS